MGFFANCLLAFVLGIIVANSFTSARKLVVVSVVIVFVIGPAFLLFGFPKIPVYNLFGVAGLYIGFKLTALRFLASVFQNPKDLLK